jgi:glycosyltransferase involved in cell wall biosynthesis
VNTCGIILTLNEEIHINRCISSLKNYVNDIVILDSGSSDNTIRIAKDLGARVYFREWDNPSSQLNWAIDNILSKYDWVIRIDADEYIYNVDNNDNLNNYLKTLHHSINGVEILRSIKFLGKILKFGGVSDIPIVRIFKPEYAHTDGRIMDEHVMISTGKIIRSNIVIIDDNKKNIHFWLNKHINYANAEFIEYKNLLKNNYKLFSLNFNLNKLLINFHIEKRIKLRNFYYLYTPLILRSLLYFNYRYFIKLGFLDGRQGFIFHFLQAFWYRLIIDIMIIQELNKNND